MLTPDSVLLTGRRSLVTGAAVGIGRATAVALARFGADVAVCDRDGDGLAATAEAIERCGRRSHTGVLDVRDAEATRAFVEGTVVALGGLDVVVNNAGGGFAAAFTQLSSGAEQALIAENFGTVTNVVRAAAPHLARGAVIVNVTSIEAHRAAPGFAVYAAMKAAVANLTKSLALELGEHGIRVVCVAPDVIPTPGIGDLPGVVTPLGGPGDVDDVAAAIVFLAGDMAGFITGTTVHVDGGNHAAAGWRRANDGRWMPA